MKLFISNHVVECNSYPIRIIRDYNEQKTRICIVNISKDPEKPFIIEFPFVKQRGYSWSGTFSMRFSKLIQQDNEYVFLRDKKLQLGTDNCIYALLYRGKSSMADELYISEEYKKKVTVLEKIEFYVDFLGREFVDSMYFIKIDLSIGESIPVYFSAKETSAFRKSIKFWRNSSLLSATEDECYISLNEKNRESYVALSEL